MPKYPMKMDASRPRAARLLRLNSALSFALLCLLTLVASGQAAPQPMIDWVPTADFAPPSYWHTANLLPDGKVLIAGGISAGFNQVVQDVSRLYDPTTATWALTGRLNVGRFRAVAITLQDGRVLMIGGQDQDYNVLSTTELYDPATGLWTLTGSTHVGRLFHDAVLLKNGTVLVAGGNGSGQYLTSAEIYNPATGVWKCVALTKLLTSQKCLHGFAILLS